MWPRGRNADSTPRAFTSKAPTDLARTLSQASHQESQGEDSPSEEGARTVTGQEGTGGLGVPGEATRLEAHRTVTWFCGAHRPCQVSKGEGP